MDYREELLTRTLLILDSKGMNQENINMVKTALVMVVGEYEITERCTELAIIDDSNTKIIKMFLGAKRVEGGSDETARNRRYILDIFNQDVNKPFNEITTFDILYWLGVQQEKDLKLSTVESYRVTIASLFSWLTKNKIIKENPMEGIKPIKHPQSVRKSFTNEEIDDIREACKSKKERAIVELFLTSGIRCEELCNLKWKDIDFNTKEVQVIEGKGGKNRITMIDDVAKKYLLKYKDSVKYDSEYVFAVKYRGEIKPRSTDSVNRLLECIGNRAGVSEIYPHKFRHTFATMKYKRGVDIRMIQQFLGHSNINTTMIYIDGDLSMLRTAYEKSI